MKVRVWEKELPAERLREHGKKSETGMISKLLGLKGTCVVSYHACRGQWTEHQNTEAEGRWHDRRGGEQKPQRPGWQGGETAWC